MGKNRNIALKRYIERRPYSMSSSKFYQDEPNIAEEIEASNNYQILHLDSKSHDFNLGDQVQISGQETGVIKYLGTTHFQVHS